MNQWLIFLATWQKKKKKMSFAVFCVIECIWCLKLRCRGSSKRSFIPYCDVYPKKCRPEIGSMYQLLIRFWDVGVSLQVRDLNGLKNWRKMKRAWMSCSHFTCWFQDGIFVINEWFQWMIQFHKKYAYLNTKDSCPNMPILPYYTKSRRSNEHYVHLFNIYKIVGAKYGWPELIF